MKNRGKNTELKRKMYEKEGGSITIPAIVSVRVCVSGRKRKNEDLKEINPNRTINAEGQFTSSLSTRGEK